MPSANPSSFALRKVLFRREFALLRELMRLRSAVEGHGDPSSAVYARFTLEAERLGPRHRKALLHRIDTVFDGMGTRLVADVHLSGDETLLLCYTVMGLDADLIADLMELPGAGSVHSRRYRLKRKIRLHGGPRRAEYLEFIE